MLSFILGLSQGIEKQRLREIWVWRFWRKSLAVNILRKPLYKFHANP